MSSQDNEVHTFKKPKRMKSGEIENHDFNSSQEIFKKFQSGPIETDCNSESGKRIKRRKRMNLSGPIRAQPASASGQKEGV